MAQPDDVRAVDEMPASRDAARPDEVRARLQRRYGDLAVIAGDVGAGGGDMTAVAGDVPAPAAAAADVPAGAGCGGSTSGCAAPATDDGDAATGTDPVAGCGARYDVADHGDVPAGLAAASLGCGNPVAVADLRSGEDVLDLGSGAGLDVILSARRVGPAGHAYGLDMTGPMLAAARANAASAGVANATFLEGYLEAIPLAEGSVDVIVSNCVINLSVDKPAAFAEMHRVLAPGGRLAISDTVADGVVPAHLRADPDAWDGCLAGALTREAYRDHLAAAGFVEVTLTDSHPIDATFTSVIVRARRAG